MNPARGYAALSGLVLLVGLFGSSCSSERKSSNKRLTRRGDAAPVVMVERKKETAKSFGNESEPNDEAGKAQALPFAVRGVFQTEADVDVYRIKIPQDGMLAVEVSAVADADVRVAIRGAKGKTKYLGDRGPAGTSEGLPNVPVKAGQELDIVLTEFISKRELKRRKRKRSKARQGASKPYELSAELVTPELGDESEPNEKTDGAVRLMLGDRGHGFFGWSKDVDLWRVALDGFGSRYGLDVDVLGVAKATLTLEVLGPDGKSVLKRTGEKGRGVFIRGLRASADLGEYVLRLSSSRAVPNERYEVSANSRRLEEGTEVEPNDSSETANAIRSDATVRKGVFTGHLVGGDRDVLKLSPPTSPSILDLTLDPSATVDAKLAIRIGGQTVTELNGGAAGAIERSGAIPVGAGKNITLVIQGRFAGDTPSAYKLSWSLESGTFEPPPEDALPPQE